MGDSGKSEEWRDLLARFCRDLGLCNAPDGGMYWGAHNHDPEMVAEIAEYYLRHQELVHPAREALLFALMESIDDALRAGGPPPNEWERAAVQATATAMGDQYDRDAIAYFWEDEKIESLELERPVSKWIKQHFPGWSPPPSIWSRP